jgi:hypothetical protein
MLVCVFLHMYVLYVVSSCICFFNDGIDCLGAFVAKIWECGIKKVCVCEEGVCL